MFSEQDVDRELKAALSVSPSPDFETRVLQRVEADRPPYWAAHYGSFAAAASLVIAAGVFYALSRTPAIVAPVPTPQIVEHTARPAVMPRPESPAGTTTTEPPRGESLRASRSAVRSTPRIAEPEVLVPRNQMEAMRRLVRAVSEGRIEPPVEPLQGPLAPPASLAVTPLVVDPIPVPPLGPVSETPAPSIRRLQ